MYSRLIGVISVAAFATALFFSRYVNFVHFGLFKWMCRLDFSQVDVFSNSFAVSFFSYNVFTGYAKHFEVSPLTLVLQSFSFRKFSLLRVHLFRRVLEVVAERLAPVNCRSLICLNSQRSSPSSHKRKNRTVLTTPNNKSTIFT